MDNYRYADPEISDVSSRQFIITPDDEIDFLASNELEVPRFIELNDFIGTLTVVPLNNILVTRSFNVSGSSLFLPMRVKKVLLTGSSITQGTIIGHI